MHDETILGVTSEKRLLHSCKESCEGNFPLVNTYGCMMRRCLELYQLSENKAVDKGQHTEEGSVERRKNSGSLFTLSTTDLTNSNSLAFGFLAMGETKSQYV